MDCTKFLELLPPADDVTNKPDNVCPVNWALNVAATARINNCGISVMCRDGMQQLYVIIKDITTEKGKTEDIELIGDICDVLEGSEGCDVAKKASTLIGTSLKLYLDDWNAHIMRKRCAANVCYEAIQIAQGGGMKKRKKK